MNMSTRKRPRARFAQSEGEVPKTGNDSFAILPIFFTAEPGSKNRKGDVKIGFLPKMRATDQYSSRRIFGRFGTTDQVGLSTDIRMGKFIPISLSRKGKNEVEQHVEDE